MDRADPAAARMTLPPDLSARLAALPLDRAPLRRAGLLAVLLVVLLVAGRAFGPSRPAPAPRNDVQAPAEEASARPAPAPSGWTGGRLLAVGLLVAGGVGAFALRRRRPGTPSARHLDVLETQPLGATPALQLVACADEVLLVSVAADGARVLRHWPRDRFDGPPALALPAPHAGSATSADAPTVSGTLVVPPRVPALATGRPPVYPTFADALAQASGPGSDALQIGSVAPPWSALPMGDGQDEGPIERPGLGQTSAQPGPPPLTPLQEADSAGPAIAPQTASPLSAEEAQGEGPLARAVATLDPVPATPPVAAPRVATPVVAAPVAERFLTGLPQFGAAHA